MSNYTQNVFFTPKDSLTTGDPAKKIKGSEMDAELSEIQTAIASKQDTSAKNTANGYAGLDAGGLLSASQWPATGVLTDAANVFTQVQSIANTQPVLLFNETDAAADAKRVRFVSSAGFFYGQIGNDAESVWNTFLLVGRSGATISSLDLTASAITLAGAVALTSTLNVTGSSVFAGITATSAIVGGAAVLTNNSGLNASNINAGSIAAAYVPLAAVTQYQGNLSIAESQISDGSVYPRIGSTETISGSWSFNGISTATITSSLTRSGQGRYPYLNGSGNTGGAITLSTSAAGGSPNNGDIWIQHAA